MRIQRRAIAGLDAFQRLLHPRSRRRGHLIEMHVERSHMPPHGGGGAAALGVQRPVEIPLDWIVPARFCMSQRSEEHKSELQSLMRISYAVFCLKKKKQQNIY